MRGSAVALAGLVMAVAQTWPSAAMAQGQTDPVAALAGSWDLPGTRVTIEIRPNRVVHHWSLGVGDIAQENASFYKIMYHQHALICRYEIKKYGENELAFVIASEPSPSECNLGLMRRAADVVATPQTQPPKAEQKGDAPVDAEKKLGSVLRDCPDCLQLTVVPSGSFLMGSPAYEAGRSENEGPQRRVVIRKPFAVGIYAVTVDEFRAFVADSGHRTGDNCGAGNEARETSLGSFEAPPGFAPGFDQSGSHPVVCVNWQDAKAFVAWLARKTGKPYRLLTEAEREYVARAGTTTPYWWGEGITPAQALYDTKTPPPPQITPASLPTGGSEPKASSGSRLKPKLSLPGASLVPAAIEGRTAPVQRYQPNDWGLYQVHGNVAEWTEDCWTPSVGGSSNSSAAVTSETCAKHVLKGGAWSYPPSALRAAFREPASGRFNHVGFRVARDLDAPH